MSVLRPPHSRLVQNRILDSLCNSSKEHNDTWEYSVTTDWLIQLKAILNDQSLTSTIIPPLKSSFNDSENSFIGESIWKILVSWYSLEVDYALHRRPISSKYMVIPGAVQSYVLADKTLDFIHVSMCLLEHIEVIEKQSYQQIYMWDDFEFIQLQLRRTLGIQFEQGLRVWIMIKNDGQEVFLGILTLQAIQASASFGGFLCSKLPSLLQAIQKRQELPSASTSMTTETLSSFSSIKSHLSESLLSCRISIILCGEVLDRGDAQQCPSFLSGINLGLILQRKQNNWSQGLHSILDKFEEQVNYTVQAKRSELMVEAEKIINYEMESTKQIKQDVESAQIDLTAREKQFIEREKQLDEREHDLNSKVDKFKRGLTDYLIQKKRLETELSRIEDQNKFSNSKVELNIGGIKYTTSTVTLTQEEDSLLGLMFSGRHNIHRDTDGSYFIDRDGTNFGHILNYLRNGVQVIQILAQETNVLKQIFVEAEFYRLVKLKNYITSCLPVGSLKSVK